MVYMEKKCLYCTKHLLRTDKENNRDWSKRRFCNRSCVASYTHLKFKHLFWRNSGKERKCFTCKFWFPATSDFFKKDSRKLNGISGTCKICLRVASHQLHKNTEGSWTKESKQQMFLEQDGKCAICKSSIEFWTQAKADHDHITKKSRGLLCDRCNRGIGFFRDDTIVLKAAIEYLGKYTLTTL